MKLLACALSVAVASAVAARPRAALRAGALVARAPNPLLDVSELPDFVGVRPEHVRPAVTERLAEGAERLSAMERSLAERTAADSAAIPYEDLILPLEDLYEHVGRPWDIIGHLKSVQDTASLREAVDEVQPQVVAFWQAVSQSKPIFECLQRLRDSPSFTSLTEARRRTVEKELLDRRLGGVGLSGAEAEEFNTVSQKLSSLSTEFSNNGLDAAKAWNVTITTRGSIQGIPQRTLESMAAAARKEHPQASADEGPWVLTFDWTVLGPVLTYAEDRSLRETVFRASATRASKPPHDNTPTIGQILKSRQRQAELLGFSNYAELSLASKMAKLSQVHELYDELLAKGRPAAIEDERELQEFAENSFGVSDLALWDKALFANRLKQKRYDVDAEALRVYFPFPEVLKGMFELSGRLFDTTIELDDSAPNTLWHKDVRLYKVAVNGTARGHLAIDPYSRPGEKRAGAWVQPMITRRKTGSEVQKPLAAVVTNFPAPQAGRPSLLSLGETSTLFHEFGHALQHVLTVQNETSVSGLNGVEWDAVEIASQFMEYFVEYDRTTLYSFARHHETGEPLPEATYDRLREATHFRAGTGTIYQVYLGSVDLRLHEKYDAGEDPNAIGKALATEILVTEGLPEDRKLCSFSHIFAGGYAAGYYSYQWSKVLSADTFSAFDEAGLDDEHAQKALGRRLASTLLGLGGGRDPAQVFRDFRGRAPSAAALLKYSGLA